MAAALGGLSETALFADALAIFDHVRGEHSEITVMGRSLGGGIAVQLASARPVERLVLVTPSTVWSTWRRSTSASCRSGC